jgi:hypothetical protein
MVFALVSDRFQPRVQIFPPQIFETYSLLTESDLELLFVFPGQKSGGSATCHVKRAVCGRHQNLMIILKILQKTIFKNQRQKNIKA